MHLGQTTQMLSSVLDVPSATMEKIGRLCRERGYVRKGARGFNAPHMTPLEVARLIIGVMASESPATAIERLEYLASLPHVAKAGGTAKEIAFEQAFAALLDRCGSDPVADSIEIMWSVFLDPALSTAGIASVDESEYHEFSALLGGGDDEGPELPYITGLQRTARIGFLPLIVIGKAVSGRSIPSVREEIRAELDARMAARDGRFPDEEREEVE